MQSPIMFCSNVQVVVLATGSRFALWIKHGATVDTDSRHGVLSVHQIQIDHRCLSLRADVHSARLSRGELECVDCGVCLFNSVC